MIIIQTFTMARWQIVVKTSEATKQTKDQNNNKNKHVFDFAVLNFAAGFRFYDNVQTDQQMQTDNVSVLIERVQLKSTSRFKTYSMQQLQKD